MLGVRNPTKDSSTGSDLFDLPERKYVISGSYLDNAVIELIECIVILNRFGLLEFKDKNYRDSQDTSRNGKILMLSRLCLITYKSSIIISNFAFATHFLCKLPAHLGSRF